MQVMERMGQTITPEIQARLEETSKNVPLRMLGLLGTYIFVPVMAMLFAGSVLGGVQHGNGRNGLLQTGPWRSSPTRR
jgi:hypothetical protein